MTAPLRPDDFAAFFRELWGYDPFPWQARLVDRTWHTGRFPDLLDLPTGAGKTSVLDVAVFLMALASDGPTHSRRHFPRRAIIVVDRRVVVDQAAERASFLAETLRHPDGDVLCRVAERLRRLAGHDEGDEEAIPLAWAQLRGGMARDEGWARHPAQPLVGASTVDQIGSRLLFRGYGISEGARPIHAGLLGNDTVIFLDEVHLSEPFRDTLRTTQALRQRAERPLQTGWQVVEMSATPAAAPQDVFRLEVEDRRHPILSQRLEASKPTRLFTVATKGSEAKCRQKLAQVAVEQARHLLERHPHVRTLAIVVNRVDTARHAAELLAKARVEHVLLTGRSRPLDRERVLRDYEARIRAHRTREEHAAPFVVVATQCIEAGADFDFDALVTECASLDALRQRFGRVDRLGELHAAGKEAPSVVLARQDQLDDGEVDPIYGAALRTTFRWLEEQAEAGDLDFGTTRLAPPADGLEKLLAPRSRAPQLLGGHLDLWSQTRPRPHADPEVSLWLHGIRKASADVFVLWRADLDDQTLDDEMLCEAVSACPPSPLEAVSLPLWAARAWLQGARPSGPADVEGGEEATEDARGEREVPVRFVCWRGDDSEVSCDPAALRPGETVVLPARLGGLDPDGNWDPSATEPVPDLGELVQLVHRGRSTLRLHPALWPELPAPPRPGDAEDDDARTDRHLVAEYLEAVRSWVEATKPLEQVLGDTRALVLRSFLRFAVHYRRIQVGPGRKGWWVLRGPRISPARLARAARGTSETLGLGLDDFSSAEDSASFTATEVTLAEHLKGVGRLAARFARACGLPSSLAVAVELAGELHDLGKADHRFQAMLCGGDRAQALALLADGVPLAKSAIPAGDRRRRRYAQDRAGWPRGGRHELLSVSLAAPRLRSLLAERLPEASEEDVAALETLVLHLVASHHGWCRPFPRPLWDPLERDVAFELNGHRWCARLGPERYQLDSGAADRFWEATQRYGWWGLAWLEAMVRLADHRRSEWEANRRQGVGTPHYSEPQAKVANP